VVAEEVSVATKPGAHYLHGNPLAYHKTGVGMSEVAYPDVLQPIKQTTNSNIIIDIM